MKVLVAALCMILAAKPSLAQEAEATAARNIDLATRAAGGALADVMAAQDLFSVALANKDPLAALAAARIMSGVGLTPVARTPVDGKAAVGGVAIAVDARRMFDTARALALDEGIAALVETERAGHDLPPLRSVGATSAQIAPNGKDRWDLAFFGSDLAEVAVLGASGGVLDIRIEDSDGHVVCQQAGPRDRLYCPFVPLTNAVFSVIVANPDAASAQDYLILTN